MNGIGDRQMDLTDVRDIEKNHDAALTMLGQRLTLWRHIKTGGLYLVLGMAMDKGQRHGDMEYFEIVYFALAEDSMKMYTRPCEEWRARFEPEPDRGDISDIVSGILASMVK